MIKQKSGINSIFFILMLVIIICVTFFLFAYIQRLSSAEQATEQKVKRVEVQCNEAELHIQKQDSMIHILEEQVRLLQKAKP